MRTKDSRGVVLLFIKARFCLASLNSAFTEGWGARLLALQSRAGNWGGPQEDGGLLMTLYTLVVLMDLGS